MIVLILHKRKLKFLKMTCSWSHSSLGTVFLVKSLSFNGAVLQNAYAQSFSPLDSEIFCVTTKSRFFPKPHSFREKKKKSSNS